MGLSAGAAGFQTQPEVGERLPFWLFWLLLCVILLLLFIIFLRDKGLRRRLSSFLSGARRRMVRLRLQAKLRREKEKKTALWKELGKKAWSEDVAADCIAEESAKLAAFKEEMHAHQMAWHEIYSRVEALGREHEAAAARFRALIREVEEAKKPLAEERRALASRKSEILDAIGGAAWEVDSAGNKLKALDKEGVSVEDNTRLARIDRAAQLNKIEGKAAALAERIGGLQAKVPLLHEERQDLERRQAEAEARIAVFNERLGEIEAEQKLANRAHDREVQEWLKTRERTQDIIVEIQRLMEPLFETMGRHLDEARLDRDDLTVYYFQIDAINKAIRDIEDRIEHLQ